MDKYGVSTPKATDPKVKEAAAEGRCPWCGLTLSQSTTPHCPVHGSKPFEGAPRDDKQP